MAVFAEPPRPPGLTPNSLSWAGREENNVAVLEQFAFPPEKAPFSQPRLRKPCKCPTQLLSLRKFHQLAPVRIVLLDLFGVAGGGAAVA